MYQLYEEYRERNDFNKLNIFYISFLMFLSIYSIQYNPINYIYFLIVLGFTVSLMGKKNNLLINEYDKYTIVFLLINEGHYFIDLNEYDMYNLISKYKNYPVSEEKFLKFVSMYNFQFLKKSLRFFRIRRENNDLIHEINKIIDDKKKS